MKLEHYLTSYTKSNPIWTKDLNLRTKTIKHLEENLEGKTHNIGFVSEFLDKTPEVQPTKEKIEKLDFIKIKTSVL